eukprot:4158523-Prymnesium_polylepis.1
MGLPRPLCVGGSGPICSRLPSTSLHSLRRKRMAETGRKHSSRASRELWAVKRCCCSSCSTRLAS